MALVVRFFRRPIPACTSSSGVLKPQLNTQNKPTSTALPCDQPLFRVVVTRRFPSVGDVIMPAFSGL